MNNYYKRENTSYIFDGSLLNFLIDNSVSNNTINNNKIRMLNYDENRDLYYKEFKHKNNILIETNKIMYIRRMDIRKSVYDNFLIPCEDSCVNKFNESFDRLINNGINALRDEYLTGKSFKHSIQATYYVDEDRYEILNNGCHRSIAALLFGFNKILADVTYKMIDKDKHNKYLEIYEFYNKYHIENIYENHIDEKDIVICFKENNIVYYIKYKLPNGDYLLSIKNLIDYDKKMLCKYCSISEKIKRFIFSKKINWHLELYIRKNGKYNLANYNRVIVLLKYC